MSARRPLVLCYHAVSDDWLHRLALPKSLLLRQVRLLTRIRRLHVTFDDAFRSIEAVIPELAALGLPITVFACAGFADAGGAPLLVPELASQNEHDREGLRTMTWDELRELADRGVEIGSHGVGHAHLTELDEAGLEWELHGSKQLIEAELGRPCTRFAYPYGDHDARVRAAVRAAGYAEAFALRGRRGGPYARRRVDLYRRHTPVRALLRSL